MPEKNTNTHNISRHKGRYPGTRLPLRYRLALSFALLFVIITAACWLFFQNELNRSLNDYSNVLGTSLAKQTAASVRELVLVNDLLGLNVLLTQLVRDEAIAHASVFDVDGNPLSSAGRDNRSGNAGQPVYQAEINVQEAIAGSVSIGLNQAVVASYQSRLRNLFLVLSAVSLVLVVTTAIALAGRITGPMMALAASIRDRTGGKDEPIGESHDELENLRQSVDLLLDEYANMQERLLESGAWEAENIHDDDGPAREAASLLVIKVVNINTAIELLHPATLASLMREYLFYLNQAARLYGGEINRQSGDSVLLLFSHRTCGEKHSINALQCAGLFQLLMSRVSQQHREQGSQVLEFRLAIHSGDVFIAQDLAPNGNDSLLGKTIDIAYFLSKQAAPNQLVISESACSQARQFEDFDTSGQREISMPADNVAFMAYILESVFAGHMELVRKQCGHILGTAKEADTEAEDKQGAHNG